MTIVGARPQFVKAAVISRLLRSFSDVQEIIVHTGQHFDHNMSDVFFNELNIPAPDYFLNLNTLSHGSMTGRMMEELEKIAFQEKPDLFLIYGDTNSTLAGALVGSKLHIPIAHVEAGLRSFNRKMPEEINRVLSDHVSTFLFCPTFQAVSNLKKEGIEKGVFHTGDVMYDATLFAIEKMSSHIIDVLGLKENKYALLTLHRQENTDTTESMQKILDYVRKYAHENDINIIWPLHPRMRSLVNALNTHDFKIIDPVSYQEMHTLLSFAHSVLTDSGGLQKEAYFHQKPCVTLRSETEWVETISCGWNRLWTTSDYSSPPKNIDEYGLGKSGELIVSCLMGY